MPDARGPGRPPKYSDEEKTQALAIYVDSGPATAATLTGIPSGTIRSWASRRADLQQLHVQQTALQVAELNARSAMTWAETRSEVVRNMAGAAAALSNVIHDKIEAENIRDAKDAALTLAILIDKVQLLTGGATGRHEREDTVTIRQELLAEGRSRVMELMPPTRTRTAPAATGTDG